jgi:hypothetical protein
MAERRNRPAQWFVPAVVASILSGTFAQTANAQNSAQTATEQTPREVETVIVTGSNIRRANAETFVPITVLDERAIEVRGALLPSELLTSLPLTQPPRIRPDICRVLEREDDRCARADLPSSRSF